jgi:hypothetical protein
MRELSSKPAGRPAGTALSALSVPVPITQAGASR